MNGNHWWQQLIFWGLGLLTTALLGMGAYLYTDLRQDVEQMNQTLTQMRQRQSRFEAVLERKMWYYDRAIEASGKSGWIPPAPNFEPPEPTPEPEPQKDR